MFVSAIPGEKQKIQKYVFHNLKLYSFILFRIQFNYHKNNTKRGEMENSYDIFR